MVDRFFYNSARSFFVKTTDSRLGSFVSSSFFGKWSKSPSASPASVAATDLEASDVVAVDALEVVLGAGNAFSGASLASLRFLSGALGATPSSNN